MRQAAQVKSDPLAAPPPDSEHVLLNVRDPGGQTVKLARTGKLRLAMNVACKRLGIQLEEAYFAVAGQEVTGSDTVESLGLQHQDFIEVKSLSELTEKERSARDSKHKAEEDAAAQANVKEDEKRAAEAAERKRLAQEEPSNTKLKLAKLLMNLAQLFSRSSAPTAGTEKHPVTTHRVAYPKDDFG